MKTLNVNHKGFLVLSRYGQVAKFFVVGCSNFLVSFAVYYLIYNYAKLSNVIVAGDQTSRGYALFQYFHQLGIKSLDATVANICGYCAGIINSFIWNKKWTFQSHQKSVTQFQRFVLVNIGCIILSTIGVFIFVDTLGWSYKIVWFGVNGLITVLSFFIYKFWIFRPSEVGRI